METFVIICEEEQLFRGESSKKTVRNKMLNVSPAIESTDKTVNNKDSYSLKRP